MEDIDLTRTRQVGALLDPGESEADSPLLGSCDAGDEISRGDKWHRNVSWRQFEGGRIIWKGEGSRGYD